MTRPLLNALPPGAHTSSLLRRFLQVVHQRLGLLPALLREAVLHVCSSEQTHPEDKKNISSISNYFAAVSASDGFMDAAGGLTCVVECGEKTRRGFQTGGAAERSACGRAHKGRSHGLLLARLVYQVQREGARGASGGRRPQLGGAGVLRGQVVTYPLRTP